MVIVESKDIKFTPLEWEILQHRLDVPCAIADALFETYDEKTDSIIDDPRWTWDNVHDRAETLTQENIDLDNELDMAILYDAIDGSTYFCNMKEALDFGEISKGKYMSYHKAANSIENKTGVRLSRG
jgi:hypothetical protein